MQRGSSSPQNPIMQQFLTPVGKYWMIFTIVVVIDIAAVILPIVSYFQISQLSPIQDHVYNLDGLHQLKDIKVIKEENNNLPECPDEYHDLFSYKFQGFKPFYLCKQTILPYIEGETYVDEHEQCRFYSDTDLVNFSVMKLGKSTVRICGKYANRNIKLKAQCEKNEKVCTFIKDQESYICAATEDDCPINQIIINEDQSLKGEYEHSLSFMRQAQNQMPIIGFDVVEGSQRCKDPRTTTFKDRKYHKMFKRNNSNEQCDSDHLYSPVFEMNEQDLYDVNNYHFLNEIIDFNTSSNKMYTAVTIRQIPWNPKYQSSYDQYLAWWQEGRFSQKDLQIFFCCFNLFVGLLVVITSYYSSNKNENIKIGFRMIQIVILWVMFFESILRNRMLFSDIVEKYKITHPQIQTDVLLVKNFYAHSIDFLDTSMIASVTTSVFLAVMQKWYFRKPSVSSRVSLHQLQTFQPFFDDDQI